MSKAVFLAKFWGTTTFHKVEEQMRAVVGNKPQTSFQKYLLEEKKLHYLIVLANYLNLHLAPPILSASKTASSATLK